MCLVMLPGSLITAYSEPTVYQIHYYHLYNYIIRGTKTTSTNTMTAPRFPDHNGYKSTEEENAELLKYILRLQKNGVIRRSTSDYSSPIIFVHKDNEVKICHDFRLLNAISTRANYPLPRISTQLDTLKGHKWYTKLDLQTAYTQTRLQKDAVSRAAFTCKFGKFEPLVTMFGLSNVLELFQRMMGTYFADHVRAGYLLIYYEGFVVFSDGSRDEHNEKVMRVLETMQGEEFTCRLPLCQFSVEEVDLLGYSVSKHGRQPCLDRIEVANSWRLPQTGLSLKCFMKIVEYFETSIDRYHHKAAPLYVLVEECGDSLKTTRLNWTESDKRAFKTLQTAFVETPFRKYLNSTGSRRIVAQASRLAAGGILMHMEDGFQVVEHYSVPLEPELASWSPEELEQYALLLCQKHWAKEIAETPPGQSCEFDTDWI